MCQDNDCPSWNHQRRACQPKINPANLNQQQGFSTLDLIQWRNRIWWNRYYCNEALGHNYDNFQIESLENQEWSLHG